MEQTRSYDVVIIGGGVVGAAAAWKLSAAGARVALLERDDLCGGASATNPGFCVLSYRENPLSMGLALRQQASWAETQREIGDVEYRQSGGLMPITDEGQLAALTGLCKHAHGLGLADIGIITAKEAVELEPALSGSPITAACWCPGEGKVNPFKLNLAMADKARALGASLFPHTPVTGINVQNGVVTSVETPRGAFCADLFVAAAGAWTRDLCKLAGREIPVCFERGEAMVTMQVQPRLRRMITDGALFNKPAGPFTMAVGACMAQTVSGNIVLAQATTRPPEHDKRNTFEGVHAVAKRVLTLFPGFSDLEIIRMWAGLVSYAPDKQPVFGPLASPRNLFIANSFHSAIALSPSIGDLVAAYYKTGRIPEEARAYTPERFAENG